MASTNKTPHYQLPQYIGTDEPTYLGDFNSAMLTIDTNIYQADTTAKSADTNATNAITQVTEMQADVTQLKSDVTSQGAQLTTTTNLANTLNNKVNAPLNTGQVTITSTDTTNVTIVQNENIVSYNTITIGNLKLVSLYGLRQIEVMVNDVLYLSDLNKVILNIPALNNGEKRRVYMFGQISFKTTDNVWHIASCTLDNRTETDKNNFQLSPFYSDASSLKLAKGQVNLTVQCCLID